jgi:hypothetical protein
MRVATMPKAMFTVTIGSTADGSLVDNARRLTVLATTATTAIEQVALQTDEYITEVALIVREDLGR